MARRGGGVTLRGTTWWSDLIGQCVPPGRGGRAHPGRGEESEAEGRNEAGQAQPGPSAIWPRPRALP